MKFVLFSGKYTTPALAQVPGGCEDRVLHRMRCQLGAERWGKRGPALGVCVLRANVYSSQPPRRTCVPCSQRRKLREAHRGDISEVKESRDSNPHVTQMVFSQMRERPVDGWWGGGGGGQGGESFFNC